MARTRPSCRWGLPLGYAEPLAHGSLSEADPSNLGRTDRSRQDGQISAGERSQTPLKTIRITTNLFPIVLQGPCLLIVVAEWQPCNRLLDTFRSICRPERHPGDLVALSGGMHDTRWRSGQAAQTGLAQGANKSFTRSLDGRSPQRRPTHGNSSRCSHRTGQSAPKPASPGVIATTSSRPRLIPSWHDGHLPPTSKGRPIADRSPPRRISGGSDIPL